MTSWPPGGVNRSAEHAAVRRMQIAAGLCQTGTMRTRPLIPILLFSLLLAACGGDEEVAGVASIESTTTTSTTVVGAVNGQEAEAAMLAFTACLRAEGVDVPDPSVDADGNPRFTQPPDLSAVTPDELNAAIEACRDELEQVTIGFIGTDLTGIEDALLEYAQCMRANGFDLPDPKLDFNFGGEGGFQGPFGEIDFNDPDFIAADEQCSQIIESLNING